MSQTENFLQDLDKLIESKHLLKHEFYLAWSRGELSKECLREYAKEYYHHVKAFPTYLSAVHSHTENPETRKALLKNLIEEEAGSPNHPDLWKNFALELGTTEQELTHHLPNKEISSLVSIFKEICSQKGVAEGIGALYAYESQIPAICVSKIDGLKKHYGMTNFKGWEYFHVHMSADIEHAAEERELLSNHVNSQNMNSVYESADRILDALWNFLSGLCERCSISCKMA
jgi:pyrroloquinoline-quinone synthase